MNSLIEINQTNFADLNVFSNFHSLHFYVCFAVSKLIRKKSRKFPRGEKLKALSVILSKILQNFYGEKYMWRDNFSVRKLCRLNFSYVFRCPVHDYGNEYKVYGQSEPLTKIMVHREVRAKMRTTFNEMDAVACIQNRASSPEPGSESSDDDDESEDAFRWSDEYESDDDCCYVDVEPSLRRFAEVNLEEGGLVGYTAVEDETWPEEGDTCVDLTEVQKNLPPFATCVCQRLTLVATCDAARALLPYVDQEALKSELLGKPWTAASHRFPDEAEVVEYQSKFSTLTKKLNSLWSLQYCSRLNRRVLKAKLERLFLVPKKTRWDSLYDVMQFLHERYGRSAEQRQKLNSIVAALGLRSKSGKSVQFTADDMKFLQEYVQV
jgi:hypothetical protein